MSLKTPTPPPRSCISSRLLASFCLVACCLALAVTAAGLKAWAESSAAAVGDDSPQLSVAAPVQMRAVLDPTSGEVSIKSSEVQNNGTSDVLVESAAFSGAEGVSGTWTVGVAGATAALGADGVSGSLGDAEVSRGSSSPLAMSTTFSGSAAGKMVDKSLGSLTLTFKEKIETFAVYSEDDKSLTFYRRGGKPRAGHAFCGKTATEVYEGFEKEHYVFETEGSKHVPWFDVRKQVKTISVADDGIRPWYVHAWFAQMESLTSCDIAKLDTSQCTVFYDMFNGCSSLESLDLTHMDTSSAIYMGCMLKNCPKLKSVDISSFDTSRCQDLSILFSGCTELAEIKGLGNWDTSACRWMNLMFNGCKSLTEIDGLENWNVRSVETMESMFELCENLRKVDVSRFEGASLASAHAMFFHCYSLKTLDVSNLVTSACTDIICMFDGCTGLCSIQGLDKWDVSNVSQCHQAFYYCCSMQAIDVGNWRISPSGTIQAMFYRCSAVKELDLSGFDTSAATSAWGLFEGAGSLKKVTLSAGWKWVGTTGYLPEPSSDYIDDADGKWYDAATGDAFAPAEVPDGAGMYVAVNPKTAFAVYSADDGSLDFYKRISVPAIGDMFEGKTVSKVYTGFETAEYGPVIDGDYNGDVNTPWYEERDAIANVTVVDLDIRPKSMKFWFQHLGSLKSIEGLAKLDTSRAASFQHAFHATSSLSKIDVAGLDTSASSSFDACFSESGIAEINLSTWRFEKGRSLGWMFAACPNLKTVTMPHSKTASGAWFSCAFQSASSLKTVDMSGLEPINLSDVRHMFDGCASLADIKGIERWDTSSCTTFEAAFWYCSSLQSLDISGWAIHPDAAVGNMFADMASLRRIAVGEGWAWKPGGLLPAQTFDGADGKWYAASDGAAYSPADVPTGKADTYYAVAPSAFAVYSADDGSLDFYNRAGMPAVGDTWQGKSVDGVYTGFEGANFTHDSSNPVQSSLENACNTPWYAVKDNIESVSVIDAGIRPSSLSHWFANLINVRSIDIGKLETTAPVDCTWLFINCRAMTEASLPSGLAPSSLRDTFYRCESLQSEHLSMPRFDTSSCTDAWSAFFLCEALTRVPGIEAWDTSKVVDFRDMFYCCPSLVADLSAWDVSSSQSGSSIPHNYADFAEKSPGIILPKAWQPTAFAVFSADDGSLDFYKREFAKMPKAGDAFEGKAATEVYTGFETQTYEKTGGISSSLSDIVCNTPWFGRRDEIQTIVVDNGIAPHSLRYWFCRMSNVESIDLSRLDGSNVKDLVFTFGRCANLKSVALNETFGGVENLTGTFYAAASINSLDLSILQQGIARYYWATFALCHTLNDLQLADQIIVGDMSWCFQSDDALAYDCSNWDVSRANADIAGMGPNTFASNITLPKAWQATPKKLAESQNEVVANEGEAEDPMCRK